MSVCKIITKIHTEDNGTHSPAKRGSEIEGAKQKRREFIFVNVQEVCGMRIICLLIDKTLYSAVSMLKHFCVYGEHGNFLF